MLDTYVEYLRLNHGPIVLFIEGRAVGRSGEGGLKVGILIAQKQVS